MAIRVIPDKDQPSAAIEIPIEKPLLDYDIDEVEHPTPRDIDGVLVSQGFRDLVDDCRGVLMQILAEPANPISESFTDLNLSACSVHMLEITQLTGAICPGDEEVYRPGLWIVLRDPKAPPRQPLPQTILDRVTYAARELVHRFQLQ